MTDNSALPEIGALVERLRAIPVWMVGEMTPGWQEHGTTAYEAADTLATLLQSLTDLTRERDEARAALNRGRHADEDCPIAAHLDDMYQRSDDDQDKMHLAMAAYELRRGPFDHPDHFGCEIAADEMKARIAELEAALEPFAGGDIDVSHTAVITGGDCSLHMRRAQDALLARPVG